MSLAAQFLVLQLLIILVVVGAVAGVSLAQSAQEFRDVEGRRARDIAEYVAATTIVRDGLQGRFVPAVQAHVEQVRAFSADADVVIATADRQIVAASDPRRVNEQSRPAGQQRPGRPVVDRNGQRGGRVRCRRPGAGAEHR